MTADIASPAAPITATEFVDIGITDRADQRLRHGVAWVFSNEITFKPAEVTTARWCRFRRKNETIATGYFNPHSLIAGRALVLGESLDLEVLLRSRLEIAFQRRGTSLARTEARRLVFSEADQIPGLILDVYGRSAVAQSSTAGIDLVVGLLEKLIPTVFRSVFGDKLDDLVIRADAGVRKLEAVEDFVHVALGDEKRVHNVTFTEGETTFVANLIEGQKTGFFLDQRENRAKLAEAAALEPGARVLDLFCYSGAWGLRAIEAGAGEVVFVDESAPAIELVKRGLTLNKIVADKARTVVSDAFDFLEGDKNRFDIIVADPPAFAKSRKNLSAALRAYEKLARVCWRRLKPGGTLYISSCSFHVSDDDFLQVLQRAVAREGGLAHVTYRGGQAADHPVLLAMPETRYLKCLGLRKLDFQ